MSKQAIGVVGMAVMGSNLALNIESRGHAVSIYNRHRERTDEVVAQNPGKKLVPAYTLEDFVASLEKPRRILLMVKAGEPTDATLAQLKPLLDKGDIVIDGGNTFFKDTMRRESEMSAAGLHFIGTGVSGGEEGALHGPSIMPGGPREAYDLVAPILTEIAARAPDGDLAWQSAGVDQGSASAGIGRHAAGDLAGTWHLVLVDHRPALAGRMRTCLCPFHTPR